MFQSLFSYASPTNQVFQNDIGLDAACKLASSVIWSWRETLHHRAIQIAS